MALRPSRSSLLTTSTSLASNLSRRRVKPRRWAVATLPEVHGMAEFVRKGCPEIVSGPKD
jgi:hypothetical protein